MDNAKEQKNRDYLLVLSAISLLIITGAVIIWTSSKKEPTASIKQSKMEIIGSVVLTIDFGNGEKRSFEGKIIERETLFDALIQASKAGNFSYKLDEKSNLAAVESFVKNGAKSWHWYLNGKKISKPYEISLHAGDKILIRYE